MKMFVYSVMDTKIGAFGAPMFLQSEGQAVRMFSDEVNRFAADNMLYNHPEDFVLYALGEFESQTGVFETRPPVVVVSGSSVTTKGLKES